MAIVAKWFNAPDCDSGTRGFDPHLSPHFVQIKTTAICCLFLIFLIELFDNDYSKNWKAIILKKEAKLYFLHKQKKALNLWSFL